jgi:hypothetical protein
MTTEMSIEEANRIINAYGAVLAKASESGAVAYDAVLLPHPKDKIKRAILIALRHVSNIEQSMPLVAGYLGLADFQFGIGPSLEPLVSGPVPTTGADLEKTLRQVLDREPRWKKWTEIARKEMEILNQELRANGF